MQIRAGCRSTEPERAGRTSTKLAQFVLALFRQALSPAKSRGSSDIDKLIRVVGDLAENYEPTGIFFGDWEKKK